jgi:hypothetical protein
MNSNNCQEQTPDLTQKCPICRSPCSAQFSGDSREVDCSRCGKFGTTGTAEAILKGSTWAETQLANMSGFVREHQGILIQSDDLAFLESLQTPPVAEKAVKLMRRILRTYPSAGQQFLTHISRMSFTSRRQGAIVQPHKQRLSSLLQ